MSSTNKRGRREQRRRHAEPPARSPYAAAGRPRRRRGSPPATQAPQTARSRRARRVPATPPSRTTQSCTRATRSPTTSRERAAALAACERDALSSRSVYPRSNDTEGERIRLERAPPDGCKVHKLRREERQQRLRSSAYPHIYFRFEKMIQWW